MGSWYLFICPGCDYSAQVSGGKDCGMDAVVETMICHDCHELVDVLIGRWGKEGPTGDPEYDRKLRRCPGCSGNQLKAWETGGLCPRCNQAMTRSPAETMWD